MTYYVYLTYCAYISVIHICSILYLIWPKNTMHIDITPVQRNSRQAQSSVRCIVEFIQITSNFIWKCWKNGILAQFTSITMQYHFPSQCMKSKVVTSTSSQRVCDEASDLCLIPNVDANSCKIATCRDWILIGSALVPTVSSKRNPFACPWIGNIPVVNFISVVYSRWKNRDISVHMQNM